MRRRSLLTVHLASDSILFPFSLSGVHGETRREIQMYSRQDMDHVPVSKLVMSDRLIALAQEAERAGYISTAHDLVNLACAVFDEMPRLLH